MPSFEEFLAAAKEKVQTRGFNRALCGLLVKLLEDLIACIEKDETLKTAIDSISTNRRVLNKTMEVSRSFFSSRQSVKLATAQRLFGDTHQFLQDYLYDNRLLTRRSAKQAYEAIYQLTKDAVTSGLSIQLSEQAFDLAWEVDALHRFLHNTELCLVFWIDEETVDEKTFAFHESDEVLIVPCMAKQLKERLKLIESTALTPRAVLTSGFSLEKDNPFQGRIRFVINPHNPQRIMKKLAKAGMLRHPILLIPTNLKLSSTNSDAEIQQLRREKPDLIVATTDMDSKNFCHMSTVLWMNAVVPADAPGAPSASELANLDRQIHTGIIKHGTVIYEFTTFQQMTDFLNAMRLWLFKLPFVRVLLSHHAWHGGNPAPAYASESIMTFMLNMRTKLACSSLPVLIFSTNLGDLHESVYSLPQAKPTNSIEEAMHMGAMWPLTWVPEWSLFDSLLAEKTWEGELNIFDIQCFSLHSGSHPYLHAYIQSSKPTKLKSKKQEHSTDPSWLSLNWNLHATSKDTLHISVWNEGLIDTALGSVDINLKELFKSPMPLLEVTLPLRHGKKSSHHRTSSIVIKLGLFLTQTKSGQVQGEKDDFTREEKMAYSTRNLRLRGQHFGRPLVDSLRSAEEIGLRHITHTCMYYILASGLDSLGIFRMVGNRRKVKEAQEQYDRGHNITLTDPYVAASLLKLFLRELPEPIIPATHYQPFMDLKKSASYSQLLLDMRRLFASIPSSNRDLLADVLETLHRVANNEQINMMNAKNLATTIAPSLVIPREMSLGNVMELMRDTNIAIDLLQVMITFNHFIFPEDKSDEELPAEIVELEKNGLNNRLDRSPPSSPEHSDAEA